MEPIKVTEPKPNRPFMTGVVVSDKMDKTIVVQVEDRQKHKVYHKIITRHKKYKAHDEKNECKMGDKIRIQESRPYSKDKCWVVIDILERQEGVQ